ncbi:hypothetical protein MLD38_018640 [Melastoma candidum]|uniref:Uncharacterized protein n=1 Tax=Melastoma candidum TaxID=119954 RepID=A0ACB9QUD8_9MYRT|nr:hypothetical protein MLD38_018640 [Melastoma candidum]
MCLYVGGHISQAISQEEQTTRLRTIGILLQKNPQLGLTMVVEATEEGEGETTIGVEEDGHHEATEEGEEKTAIGVGGDGLHEENMGGKSKAPRPGQELGSKGPREILMG